MDLSQRIVLYGGSFDPPHMGHQFSCLYLLSALNAQAVWLIPAFNHPEGKNLLDYRHRLAMCELMARPLQDRVVVKDTEYQLGGAGRTYDTVCYIQSIYPEQRFALAIGADIATTFSSWYKAEQLRLQIPIIVIGRSGFAGGQTALDIPAVESRSIRKRVVDGDSILGLVPQSIADYIEKNNLYRIKT
jgi:nicotinate-nucleotide adenylyltransferase